MASVDHPVFARFYAWASPLAERAGVAEHRREMLGGLKGRAVEVGAGNGLNFGLYPSEVTEVVAVEPEPFLRGRAEEAAASAAVPVRVVDGTADRLPFDAGEFDAGVASLVLCSVPNQTRALSELRRVIRPGGELRFYEHVRAAQPRHARFQQRIDPIWSRLFGGCHTGRDTPAAIERAGFVIESMRRFDFRPTPFSFPVSPSVIGLARRA